MPSSIFNLSQLLIIYFTNFPPLNFDSGSLLCRCYAVLYADRNYGGRSLTVHGQIRALVYHAFDNQVSSAKIYGLCHWLFYEHRYEGDTSILSPGNYPSTQAWGQRDNVLTSLRALPPPGTTAIALFRRFEFSGSMLVLSGSLSNLHGYGFDDILSSYIITGGSWRLYEHPGYTGRSSSHGPGHYDTSRDNSVSSVSFLY